MSHCSNCPRKVKKGKDLKQVTGFGGQEVSEDLPDSALGATGWPWFEESFTGKRSGGSNCPEHSHFFVVVQSGECGFLCKEKAQG